MKKKETTIPEASADYKAMVDLLAVLTEATNQKCELQTTANQGLSDILDDLKGDYASLQETITKTEAALESIARRHPEWFESKKTIKTPYGEVSFRTSHVLEIANEEAVLARLETESYKRFPDDELGRTNFILTYTRIAQAINKEAIESAPDELLASLGLAKTKKENFTAKPASLDLGKAVAALAKEAA